MSNGIEYNNNNNNTHNNNNNVVISNNHDTSNHMNTTMRSSRTVSTVSFHNFKSQHFKLSVSNPKSKYVACLSVLSQISNCQSLGRKNKHKQLKTDRTFPAAAAQAAPAPPRPQPPRLRYKIPVFSDPAPGKS